MKNTIWLNGSWQLAGMDAGAGNWASPNALTPEGAEVIMAQVPGEVHTDLLRAGKIPDPYYGMNAEDAQWIEDKQWWYKRAFDVDEDFLQKQTYLEFDGLDTFATVYLNGEEIGRTENMFVPHKFDVSGLIRLGRNIVAVHFDPAKMDDARKMRASFGGETGPRLVGAGIWRDARLVSHDLVSIKNIHIETEIEGAQANAWVYIEVENHTGEDQQVFASVVISKGESQEKIEVSDWVSPFDGVIEAVIRIEEPEFWWPNGMGEPSLYNCLVGISCEGEVQDVTETVFGVREVRFIETDKTLLINGEMVFCKGANLAPADHLVSNVTDERYRELVQLAKDANFNMLRVRGGGIYESPAFYQTCNEMGIMILQDFMFARDSERSDETGAIVKQLRNHPCIVAWCGGYEGETVRQALKSLDRTRPLLPPFTSNFRIQGPPEAESLRKFIPEDQLFPPDSPAMQYHGADKTTIELVRRMVGEFKSLEAFAAYAGILQGELLRAEIERCRREKWNISDALLGMFNDSWPTISSSLADYYLRPKAAYYYAKRAFEPVIVSFKQIEDRVQVYVTTDDRLQGIDGKLLVGVMTFEACGLDVQESPVKVEPNSSNMVWESEPLDRVFVDTKKQCLIAMLEVRGEIVARSVHFARPWSEIEFPLPKLLVHREQLSETTHEMVISSDAYARNLAILNLPAEARPSDNYFDVLPGEQKTITIHNINIEHANELKLNVWGR
ncbi:MAG: beta-mannosidase [Armatimonadota bacterium]